MGLEAIADPLALIERLRRRRGDRLLVGGVVLFLPAATLLALLRRLEFGSECILNGDAGFDLLHSSVDFFMRRVASVDEYLAERGDLNATSPFCFVHENLRDRLNDIRNREQYFLLFGIEARH